MIDLLIGGLVQGAYFAVMGMGLVLAYRQTRVVNFAHGALASVACYTAYALLSYHFPYWLAAMSAVVASGVVALLTELLIVRTLLRTSELAAGIGTIGVAMVLIGTVSWVFGTDQMALPSPLSENASVLIGTVRIGANAVAAVLITLGLAAAIYFVLDWTRIGLMIRAASEGPVTSSMLGINVAQLRSAVWAVSGALAAIAGLLVTPANFLGPSFCTDFMVIAFVAIVLGGLESMGGVLLGAFIFGLADTFFAYWVVGAMSEILAFVSVCCVLAVLPNGLFGRRLLRVVEPALRSRQSIHSWVLRLDLGALARRSPLRDGVVLGVFGIAAAALPFIASQTQIFVLATALALFLAVLSQNLLSGYIGLVSLGQAAFMGMGAYIVAIAVTTLHVPFIAAVVAAMLITAGAAAIFSIAAARLAGVYLILLTFSLSLAFPVAVALPRSITGGTVGMPMPTPEAFGFDVISGSEIYYLALAVAVIVGLPLSRIMGGRAGRVCRAVRDSEIAAASTGVNVLATKVIVFSVSGALAALSGILMGCLVGYLVPESFSIWQSIFLLVAALIGGPSVLGSLVGAVFLEYMLFFASNLPTLPYIGLGGLVLFFLLVAPEGVVNLFKSAPPPRAMVLAEGDGEHSKAQTSCGTRCT